MLHTVEEVAARIIGLADTAPADTVLREELKLARLPREESGTVADLVFTYFRWRGWLDAHARLDEQMEQATELHRRFARNPASFTTEELHQAIPSWAAEELTITRPWLESLQSQPRLWLRARRGTGAAFALHLQDCQAGRGELSDALEYHGRMDLFRTPEFQAGEFEVQDVASQMVGLLCAPQPGETWWDACAGEGGKMLHLSDLMQNKGLIWASDRSERRIKRLRQRAARARVFNYRAVPWDGGAKLPTKTKFDGVLIDAPCSGVGTWGRNPHARWTTTREDVRELAAVQQQLLLHATAAVKPGGKLIYAVCTLTRSETDAVADLCSPRFSGFAPMPLPAGPSEPSAASGRKWIWPQSCRGNGMFVSAWQRPP